MPTYNPCALLANIQYCNQEDKMPTFLVGWMMMMRRIFSFLLLAVVVVVVVARSSSSSCTTAAGATTSRAGGGFVGVNTIPSRGGGPPRCRRAETSTNRFVEVARTRRRERSPSFPSSFIITSNSDDGERTVRRGRSSSSPPARPSTTSFFGSSPLSSSLRDDGDCNDVAHERSRNNLDRDDNETNDVDSTRRSQFLRSFVVGLVASATMLISDFKGLVPTSASFVANAAPPIAIIAEELGYYPVTNRNGETIYVPKRVSRESSKQAVQLAERLSAENVVMVGTYW